MEVRPRLPPEILEQIVWQLHQPCALGDPIAQRTLSALSLVSKVCRQWALPAKYSVVVAPRHVRDFRKWHAKVSHEIVGYNRALFVALDDVSKLTSTSAGWEADLQRLLQRLGPSVTHLSLWASETRAVLRDPAQIRGPRFRNRMPDQTMDEVVESTIKRRYKLERRLRRSRLGKITDVGLKPLKVEKDRDEQRTKAEIAAARERARQKIPNWLRRELETKKEEEVKRIYKAHIGTTVREYQHELDVQKEEAQENTARHSHRHIPDVEDDDERASSSSCLTSDEENIRHKSSSSDSDSDDDYDLDWGCMPIKLSICPALPLHEHENAHIFARMNIWTRVQELDVFIAVPGEASRYLELFSSLIACPISKFRLSSIYASLVIVIGAEGGQPCVNLARGLGQVMESQALSSLLICEFSDKHMEDISVLESAIASAVATASEPDKARSFDDRLRAGCTVKGSTNLDGNHKVRVKILQGNQAHWGKLKDRRQDFLDRSLGLTDDCWDALLR